MKLLSLLAQGSDYYTTQDYTTPSNTISNEAAAGIAAGMMIFYFIAIIVLYVISSLCLARIFKKAGIEAWKAWVPVYSLWIMLELGDQKGWWAVLMVVPIINLVAVVFLFIAMYNIGLKLGKPGAFVLVAIFLPLVWYIWLAVDKSTWQGAPVASGTQPLGTAPAAYQPPATTTPPQAPANDNQQTPPTPPPIV